MQIQNKSISWGRIGAVSVAVILAAITLFPFLWVVRTSLAPQKVIISEPASVVPSELNLDNYARVLGLMDSETAVKLGGSGQKINFLWYLLHTVIAAGLITIFQVLFSAAGAYAFGRLQFPLRNQIFAVYLAALMVPGIVMTIPNFILIKQMGLLNTYMGIILPNLLMTPFTVFFLRQFFLGINPELEEAARIDGAGTLRIFFQIILPLTQTALATAATIVFITAWNDYMWPLIVGKADNVRLLTVALGIFRSQTPQGVPDWGGLMAGTTLGIIPTLILFMTAGKKVINSIGFSGFR